MQLGGDLEEIAGNIAAKSLLVYTCDKRCIGERDKNCAGYQVMNNQGDALQVEYNHFIYSKPKYFMYRVKNQNHLLQDDENVIRTNFSVV